MNDYQQKKIKKSRSFDTLVKGQSSKLSVNENSLILNPLLLATKNPLNLELKTKYKKKVQPGKYRRHLQKLQKVHTTGLGCPWVGNSVIFRVELFWENRLGEQANFSLHWFTVREIKGKERKKYLNYFRKHGTDLTKGETVELRHILCYLDSFYQIKRDTLRINNCFIFPSSKVGDDAIRFPIARRIWDKSFEEYPLTKDILSVYRNTIWHQQELGKNKYKTINLV